MLSSVAEGGWSPRIIRVAGLWHVFPIDPKARCSLEPTEKSSTGAVNWMYLVILMVALAVFGVGVMLVLREGERPDWTMLAAGCVGLVVVLATWPLAITLAAARDVATRKSDETLTVVQDRLQAMSVMMNVISEQQLLSDRAKSVAYRDKDRDALRRAIREDIVRRDWDGALALVDDMEREFNYRDEAMRFRDEIHKAQDEVTRRQVNEATAVIDRHCRAEAWSDALREAERLMSVYRNDPTVAALPQTIEARRQAHKQQMLDAFGDALKRHDNDGAIEILRKLDLYLTRAEAEHMQDTVRNLFREKLNDLKTQFALAVQEHKWAEAMRLGDTIVRDFPNSGIAKEVKEKMDALRQRAGAPAAPGEPQGQYVASV